MPPRVVPVPDRTLDDLDLASAVPLHLQLKQRLLNRIESGELGPGDQVPTESALCRWYGVSRTPVRQALLELQREGILTRTAGRGTFVKPPAVVGRTVRLTVPDERWRGPLDRAVARRNAARTDETLRLEVQVVPLERLHDALALAIAQGRAPDLCVLDTAWAAEFAHRHYLHPLDALDPGWAAEAGTVFHPALLSVCRQGGELLAVPINADATVLWYRRDWLATEGLEPPASWAELLAVGRHFQRGAVRRRHGLGPHPLTFVGGRAGGETTTYQHLPLVWAAGGDLIDGGRVVLDSAATRRALRFLRDLTQELRLASAGCAELPWDGALRDLAAGRAALAFGGSYETFLIQAAAGWDAAALARHVGFVPMPIGPAGAAPVLLGGMAYGICRQTRVPEVAMELLRLATDADAVAAFSAATRQNAARLDLAGRNGDGAGGDGAGGYGLGGEGLDAGDAGGFLERAAELFPAARARPALRAYDLVSAQFQELVELTVAGDQPIAELSRRAAERIVGITGLPSQAVEVAA